MDDEFEIQIDDLLGDLEKNIKRGAQAVERRQNEAAVASVLGLILSGPFLVKILGKTLNVAIKFLTNNKDNESAVGNYLIALSEKMHHSLEKPFKLLAKPFTDDPKKQKIFAEIMIAGIIAILLIHSGAAAGTALSKMQVKKSLVYSAKTSIKGTELGPQLKSLAQFARRVLVKVAK